MTKDMDGYVLLESIDSTNGFGVKVFVRRPPEIQAAVEALGERIYDTGQSLSGNAQSIYEKLKMQAAHLDPDAPKREAGQRQKFKEAFLAAGVEPFYIQPIPNEYWGPNDALSVSRPWYLISTVVGHFKVGWRKRVAVLDWSKTDLGKHLSLAEKLFPNEDVTKYETSIHCWGLEKMTEYLKVLMKVEIR